MIDNVILLLTGTLHRRPVADLMQRCHPLGSFEQMEAVTIATTVEELYSAVLVDTPIGITCHHSQLGTVPTVHFSIEIILISIFISFSFQ